MTGNNVVLTESDVLAIRGCMAEIRAKLVDVQGLGIKTTERA